MVFKYVISKQTDPYRNLATEQELMRHASSGMVILFLWQNANTIVIGKNQSVFMECRVDEFISKGGIIARRCSGGGAVYHDLGNLNFSIISLTSDVKYMRYQDLIKDALLEFSIKAEFNGRNDLLIDGKKFSGNAKYTDGEVLCQHGTILISSNIGKMKQFLTPDQEKLNRNHVASVASRVVNLSEINRMITVESMMHAIIKSCGAIELDYFPDEDFIHKYTDFYADETWIYGGKR